MLPIRGDKTHVRILENGAPVAWAEITNITDSENSEIVEHFFVGQRDPEVQVMQRGFDGQINGLITNPEIDELFQRIRDARTSGVNEPVITIFYVIRYPNGTSKTFRFVQCELILANRTSGGANEPISRAISFKAKTWRIE